MDTPILDNLIFYLTAAITLIGLPVLVGGQLWTPNPVGRCAGRGGHVLPIRLLLGAPPRPCGGAFR